MNLSRYYHTLKYLKSRQIVYRIFYSIRRLFRRAVKFQYPFKKTPKVVHTLRFYPSLSAQVAWVPEKNTFTFLHQSHSFGEQIDWQFGNFGKLWTYNLHYFEYLHDAGISKEAGTRLIHDFIRHLPATPEALEPYPTALRIIFWSRFIAAHGIDDAEIDASLYAQSYTLADQIEYHLLGNHYLENGFGLFFAAYQYGDTYLYQKATDIIINELEEQILGDGGHFERAPMYHQIILYRILDCLNLGTRNPGIFKEDITPLLRKKAGFMMGWLQQITFPNGDIPLFNDSAFGIAPATALLIDYGKRLGVEVPEIPLGESGYRKFSGAHYQLLVDVGDVGPDYIPGHAHSDTLGFELYVNGQPFIVDTGISTYEKNERRQYERSTAAHNTVQINQLEQTEVWGGFRVAQRAKPVVILDNNHTLKATHKGYDRLNLRHLRTFEVGSDVIQIIDEITPIDARKSTFYNTSYAFLHFHHAIMITAQGDHFLKTDGIDIQLDGSELLEIMEYEYAPGFNRRIGAKKAVIGFRNRLQITIRVN